MDHRKVDDIISWIVLGVTMLVFLADGLLLYVVLPFNCKFIVDSNLCLPRPMLFAVTLSKFVTNIVNMKFLIPLLSITSLAFLLKEFLVKRLGVRLGINLGVLSFLLVIFGSVVIGILLTMVKIQYLCS
jgi:hypothetical protein